MNVGTGKFSDDVEMTVESLTDGTMRRLVAAERRVRRPGTSATRVSGPRYRATVKNSVTQHERIQYLVPAANEG